MSQFYRKRKNTVVQPIAKHRLPRVRFHCYKETKLLTRQRKGRAQDCWRLLTDESRAAMHSALHGNGVDWMTSRRQEILNQRLSTTSALSVHAILCGLYVLSDESSALVVPGNLWRTLCSSSVTTSTGTRIIGLTIQPTAPKHEPESARLPPSLDVFTPP